MSLLVTAGRRGDSSQFAAVLEGIRVPRTGPGRPRVRPLRVRGDKAYSSRVNRAYLRKRGDPVHDPGARRPGQEPQAEGEDRRAAPGLRPRELQGPARGRVRAQPAQAQPGGGHTVRHTRGPLRGHRPGSRDRRMAVTCRCCRSRMPC
ncbi:hypothetical protein OG923_01800 [Streptomyces halstedii]